MRNTTRKGGSLKNLFKIRPSSKKEIEALGYDPRKRGIPLKKLKKLNWGFQPNAPNTNEQIAKTIKNRSNYMNTVAKPYKAFKTNAPQNAKPTLNLVNNSNEQDYLERLSFLTKRIKQIKQDQASIKEDVYELLTTPRPANSLSPKARSEQITFLKLAKDYYEKLVKGDPTAARI